MYRLPCHHTLLVLLTIQEAVIVPLCPTIFLYQLRANPLQSVWKAVTLFEPINYPWISKTAFNTLFLFSTWWHFSITIGTKSTLSAISHHRLWLAFVKTLSVVVFNIMNDRKLNQETKTSLRASSFSFRPAKRSALPSWWDKKIKHWSRARCALRANSPAPICPCSTTRLDLLGAKLYNNKN